MKIREATMVDLKALQDLNHDLATDPIGLTDKYSDKEWAYGENGKKYFTECINKEDHLALVAEDNNEIVGYLTADPGEHVDWRPIKYIELSTFYIKEDYQSKGIGSELVSNLVEWSKKQGAVTLRVEAYAKNVRGIEFYEKVGFTSESVELEMELK